MKRRQIKRTSHSQFLGGYQLWRLSFPLVFLYHLLSTLGKYDGSPCDDDCFLDSNGSFPSIFWSQPLQQGTSGLWYEDGSQFLTKPIFTSWFHWLSWWSESPPLHQPSELLMRVWWWVGSIKQTAKCRLHGRRWTMQLSTDYNVSNGVTMIGDSVNLRAQDYLTKAIPGIQIDAVVSRRWKMEWGLWDRYLQ